MHPPTGTGPAMVRRPSRPNLTTCFDARLDPIRSVRGGFPTAQYPRKYGPQTGPQELEFGDYWRNDATTGFQLWPGAQEKTWKRVPQREYAAQHDYARRAAPKVCREAFGLSSCRNMSWEAANMQHLNLVNFDGHGSGGLRDALDTKTQEKVDALEAEVARLKAQTQTLQTQKMLAEQRHPDLKVLLFSHSAAVGNALNSDNRKNVFAYIAGILEHHKHKMSLSIYPHIEKPGWMVVNHNAANDLVTILKKCVSNPLFFDGRVVFVEGHYYTDLVASCELWRNPKLQGDCCFLLAEADLDVSSPDDNTPLAERVKNLKFHTDRDNCPIGWARAAIARGQLPTRTSFQLPQDNNGVSAQKAMTYKSGDEDRTVPYLFHVAEEHLLKNGGNIAMVANKPPPCTKTTIRKTRLQNTTKKSNPSSTSTASWSVAPGSAGTGGSVCSAPNAERVHGAPEQLQP